MVNRNKVSDAKEDVDKVNNLQDGNRRRSNVSTAFATILTLLSYLLILLTFPYSVWYCVKVIREYERAIVFRLGWMVNGKPRAPGLFWFIPWLDVIEVVDLRTVSFDVPPQEVLTADWVPLMADAVMFYRVVDPALWVTRVAKGSDATHMLALTTVRAILGTFTLEHILADRQSVAKRMKEVLYTASNGWGVHVQKVELKQLTLPVTMQRSMSSIAEAEREAKAKLIMAQGELKASHSLSKAADGLSSTAIQLRYLLSLTSAANNDTHTIVLPLPSDLMSPP